MVSEFFLLRPLSPFGQFCLAFFPWFDNTAGTLHLVEPLVQPIPSFPRWSGQIVMVANESGVWNIAARHNISSTSFSGPENENNAKCLAISFAQDVSGTTWISRLRSRLSKPQFPPTIDLKEQQSSISIR